MAEEVELKIVAQTDEALKEIDSFGKESEKTLSAVEEGFGALKVAAVAAVAALTADAVIDFFTAGIEGALDEEQAMAKLRTQLEKSGDASDEAVSKFKDLADEINNTTKYSDDAAIAAAALAKSFGLSDEKAIKLTKAAADLSAVTGKDLDQSVKEIAKTLRGSTEAIEGQIPELRTLTKEQLALGEGIDVVAEKLSGAAANDIDPYTLAIKQVGIAYGDLQKSFGEVIVNNPVVIASIQAVRDILRDLTETTKGNRSELDTFISEGLKAIVGTVPLVVQGLVLTTEAFGKLTVGTTLALAGLNEVTNFFAIVFRQTFVEAADVFLAFTEGIVGAVTDIPLVASAFQKIGVDVTGAGESIGKLRETMKGTVDDGIDGLQKFGNKTIEFAAKTDESVNSVTEGLTKFQKSVEDGAVKVLAADNASIETAKKVETARSNATAAVIADVDAVKKAGDEFKKFQENVTKNSADEFKKLEIARDEQLAKVKEFAKSGVASEAEAATLKQQINEQYAAKRSELEDKQAKESKERLEKSIAEQRAAIQQAANNPVQFAFEQVDLKETDVFKQLAEAGKPFGKQIAAGIGSVQQLLNGREGAKSLISNAAGMVGDAIVPGIGGAVSGIAGALAQGPDAVKAQVRAFVEAVPDIVVAIAESIPVVVEALVDSLINEGGLVRIAEALLRALSGEAILKNIGRQIGVDMGDAFNADVIAAKLSGGLMEFGSAFNSSIEDLFSFTFTWPAFPAFSWPALPSFTWPAFPAFSWPAFPAFPALPKFTFPALPKFSFPALPKFTFPSLPKFSFPALPQFIFPRLPKFEFPAFQPFAFPSLPEFKFPELPKFPDFPALPTFQEPSWLKDLKSLISGGGGGGGGGGVIGNVKKAFGFAEGGVIPKGFPNDTYPALTTSDERILSVDQNADFETLLANLAVLTKNMSQPQQQADSGQPLMIVLQVGEAQLAKVLLNINRQGFRVA